MQTDTRSSNWIVRVFTHTQSHEYIYSSTCIHMHTCLGVSIYVFIHIHIDCPCIIPWTTTVARVRRTCRLLEDDEASSLLAYKRKCVPRTERVHKATESRGKSTSAETVDSDIHTCCQSLHVEVKFWEARLYKIQYGCSTDT